MIATQTTHVLDSTIKGRTVAMSLDQDSLVKLMKMYTDLYADRIMACIREVSSNAYDSHVDAGNDAPIEVRLPTPLDPYLRIQDWGTGLTDDEFIDVYSKYGKSTRSDSNEYAGMMGLGCKAPLTYTSQYTIQSVKNGLAYQILVTRNAQGLGEITIIGDPLPTDAPNGVMVEIMVNREDITPFREKAAKFFSFWSDNTVLVDGSTPAKITGTPVGDNILIVKSDVSYVVMANVAYPLPKYGDMALQHGLTGGHSLVVRMPIGSCSVPPPREALADDKLSKDALRGIEKKFKELIAASIQRDINQCRSPYQAVNAMVKWAHMLPASSNPGFANYRFRGHTIPEHVELRYGSKIVPHSTSTLSKCEDFTKLPAQRFDKVLIFTNWTYAGFSALMRRKLDKWVCENELEDGGYSYVLIPDEKIESMWIDDAMVFDWNEVRKIKLDSSEVNSGGRLNRYGNARIPGSFDVYMVDGMTIGHPADEIDPDEPIFYYQGNIGETSRYRLLVEEIHTTGTLVAVPGNRLNKFKRDFPNARQARTAVTEACVIWVSSLDKETLFAMFMKQNNSRQLDRVASLDASKLDDPAFTSYLRQANKDVSKELATYADFNRAISYCEPFSNMFKEIEAIESPLTKYVLHPNSNGYSYHSVSDKQVAHFYIYANAIYAARQAGAQI